MLTAKFLISIFLKMLKQIAKKSEGACYQYVDDILLQMTLVKLPEVAVLVPRCLLNENKQPSTKSG